MSDQLCRINGGAEKIVPVIAALPQSVPSPRGAAAVTSEGSHSITQMTSGADSITWMVLGSYSITWMTPAEISSPWHRPLWCNAGSVWRAPVSKISIQFARTHTHNAM